MNTLTPKGCVEVRKGLEGCGAATAQPGPERVSAESRKARFSAQPKMRPNYYSETVAQSGSGENQSAL
jgi:hypothetical protein